MTTKTRKRPAKGQAKAKHGVPAASANNGKANSRLTPMSGLPAVASGEDRATPAASPNAAMPGLAAICAELQALQRRRVVLLKSRIMIENRLQALVAGTIGYSSSMEEKARRKVFAEASRLIKLAVSGKPATESMDAVIRAHHVGIGSLEHESGLVEKAMLKLAEQLPVAAWVRQPEQRGFGLLSLATVIGETGDLSLYSGPCKVWRRLGCAPWSFDGKTLMGATWRSGKDGKLPAEEWETFGYSPRRRSIAYLIGENLVKMNFLRGKGGEPLPEDDARPAELCYAKAGSGDSAGEAEKPIAAPAKPASANGDIACGDEWDAATADVKHSARSEFGDDNDFAAAAAECGNGETDPEAEEENAVSSERDESGDGICETDAGAAALYRARYDAAKVSFALAHPDAPPLRCHRHGMLLACKLLLKRLWIEWRRVS